MAIFKEITLCRNEIENYGEKCEELLKALETKFGVSKKTHFENLIEKKNLPAHFIQNENYLNIGSLNDPKLIQECMDGMLNLTKSNQNKKSNNFKELIDNLFGAGLAKHFMIPYNLKVWGYPASMMNASWIGERVAMVDLAKILKDYVNYTSCDKSKPQTETGSWGPNSIFKYPKYGGTGSIWKGILYIEPFIIFSF